MYQIRNFYDNDDIKVIDEMGPFQVIEYQRDLSVAPFNAQLAYFCQEMNIRKRQVVCDLSKGNITLQAGAMQWMAGDVNATTGIKGAGDLLSKAMRGKVTGESAIKPEYKGDGTLVLEPTYKHILLLDLSEWGNSVVLDDGLFLACDARLKHKTVARTNFSSAVAGGEGLFNLGIQGEGVVCLESECPREELVEVELRNDVLKVDGNFAILWSGSLDFSVERSGKSLLGSAASGEGLVNVYRGTGKVLLAPVGSDAMKCANMHEI
ncbi:AIM24 family protein [Anaerostipes sp. MSJ-23]|uniref:AIM24 family protein n=1 Tax=Anaerostipes sp. MSJ-23 TaxID=2841520 RepID=UPI001C110AEA|nr:AIM24 family protein [Anaerostipes sp. MSJ-23]MBU5460935.1 AIM24 family protein [Anaerostipes sp. MSJ-23]